MPLVLDGTNGVSGVDGTASNPAIEGTDSNTGIFYPAADTVAIGTGGTERLRVDSAGNVGEGVTPAAWASGIKALQVGANSYASTVDLNNGVTVWGSNYYNDGGNKFANASSRYALQILQDTTSGAQSWRVSNAAGTAGNAVTFTTAMTLDASGNLGIGTTTLNQKLNIYGDGTSYSALINFDRGGVYTAQIGTDGLGAIFGSTSNHLTRFMTNGSERARITSGGSFLIGGTALPSGIPGARFYVEQSAADYSSGFYSTSSTAGNNYGLAIYYLNATPNNTANQFILARDSTVSVRFEVRSNGGIANYSANNSNLSDRREKTNFAPAKNYLDIICAIPVQTFNYIDQNMEDDPGLTLGVVAQDVQAVAPEMVMESNWGSEEEPKMRLSIYQTDLQYALMKSIQELKAIVDAQAAEIAALKGNA